MKTHSPTPWILEHGVNFEGTELPELWVTIRDANRELILYDVTRLPTDEPLKENFERIVACVNACDVEAM
jgi:hypothetical protein